jgi:hypothetical protein
VNDWKNEKIQNIKDAVWDKLFKKADSEFKSVSENGPEPKPGSDPKPAPMTPNCDQQMSQAEQEAKQSRDLYPELSNQNQDALNAQEAKIAARVRALELDPSTSPRLGG